MATHFSIPAYPRLRHCTIVDELEKDTFKIVVGADYFDVTREGSRELFLKLKSFLDGTHSIDEIASIIKLPVSSVRQVVGELAQAGLLQSRSNVSEIDAQDFLRAVEDASIMWRRQIGLHPLFGNLYEGAFRQEVFLGYLIESYQYVRMLPKALLSSAKRVKNPAYKRLIETYAREELGHHAPIEKELRKIPRIGERICSAHPTIGTISLVNGFENIVRTHPLSAFCCLQLIEVRAEEARGAENHLTRMASHYEAEDLVLPYIEHMRADLQLGHAGILRSALMDEGIIPSRDAHRAVNNMHDIKHCFDAFHDSIIAYYNDISNYIPRPRVDYFAL